MKLSQFDAVIFDMDGVLTDSEPIWKIAMEQVFSEIGCHLTREDFQKTVGLRIDEVCEYWYSVVKWANFTPKDVENKIVQRMVELLSIDATPLPGVIESLEYFKAQGLKIGLATSSYSILIETILTKINAKHFFDCVHSAEHEKYGKPNPAVYLTCAENLGVVPQKCFVIEDSLNGVISGKAARMTVVCIPEKTHHPEPKLIVADYHFETLHDLISHLKY
jgi:mannitol-1-/sugar-/sorbitol-6-/2-deoxyglucose-6-phosphatase